MRKHCLLSGCFILLVFCCVGQSSTPVDIFSVRIGVSGTASTIKEAMAPKVDMPWWLPGSSNTFAGEGPDLTISKYFTNRLFVELGFAPFFGKDNNLTVGTYEYTYQESWRYKGFQLPVTVNYLLRKPEKRFNVSIGAGGQYLKANLYQKATITSGFDRNTVAEKEINLKEFQFVARPALQFRIIDQLHAAFSVNVCISPNGGRYTDHQAFSVFYTFKKKTAQ